jgi:endoglucanase
MPPIPRRALLSGLACTLAAGRPAGAAQDRFVSAWDVFAARNLRADGRIVDDSNGSISHSEGQGFALLCAEAAGDQDRFARILGWTRRSLARRQDHLFAWRFHPDRGVEDANNATDGDIMIAWALLRAGQSWQEPSYTEAGTAVTRDILRLLLRDVGGEVVLLPAAHGFEQREHIVVNPSYYVFPALAALARAVPDPIWLRVAADGLALLRRARFGRWALPPDWVALPRDGGRMRPAQGWPPRFSYDAVRVPLYLHWAGLGEEPAAQAAARFWSDPAHRRLPAWADLGTDAVSPYAASVGVRAIAQLRCAQTGATCGMPAWTGPQVPENYYSGVLALLARLAARDLVTHRS